MMIGIPATPPTHLERVRILIVDSGIAQDCTFEVSDLVNFVDSERRNRDGEAEDKEVDRDQVAAERNRIRGQGVTDRHGHGTVIANILHDVAPTAHLLIYRVADADGSVTEWDALAALATYTNADVINLSLQFGLKARICPTCGRQSHTSRSLIFKDIIKQLASRHPRPVVVAAAGNHQSSDLSFPARFSETIAIGAVNSTGELSILSNYGKQYTEGNEPDNHFVMPDGDDGIELQETIGTFVRRDELNWQGTSFATAYASGVIAILIAGQSAENAKYDIILRKLRESAQPRRDREIWSWTYPIIKAQSLSIKTISCVIPAAWHLVIGNNLGLYPKCSVGG
jgi:subtilisin family serine protease